MSLSRNIGRADDTYEFSDLASHMSSKLFMHDHASDVIIILNLGYFDSLYLSMM